MTYSEQLKAMQIHGASLTSHDAIVGAVLTAMKAKCRGGTDPSERKLQGRH